MRRICCCVEMFPIFEIVNCNCSGRRNRNSNDKKHWNTRQGQEERWLGSRSHWKRKRKEQRRGQHNLFRRFPIFDPCCLQRINCRAFHPGNPSDQFHPIRPKTGKDRAGLRAHNPLWKREIAAPEVVKFVVDFSTFQAAWKQSVRSNGTTKGWLWSFFHQRHRQEGKGGKGQERDLTKIKDTIDFCPFFWIQKIYKKHRFWSTRKNFGLCL